MKEYFIITFDRDAGKNYKSFHDDLVNHPHISNWWHYIKSSYIIGTSTNEDQLSDHFIETAKKHNVDSTHLVVKLDLNRHQGMLTEKAWNWIEKNT